MTKKTPILFLKANIPAGAHWLTVHPNGPGSKGQPILVQPSPDGKGSTVIGGAGGKLNFLKLRSVKKESEYKQEAAEAKDKKKAAAKEQRAKDKESGLLESKKKAHEALRAQKQDHEKKFIDTVSSAMGWNKKDTEFDDAAHASLSKGAQEKARQAHHRMVLKKAHDAVGLQRQMLVNDPVMRAGAGIGEIPLQAENPDTLSVEDLAPVKQANGGLGFAADYKGRAQAAGLDEKQLKVEADAVRAEKLGNMTDGQRQAAVQRGETSKMINEELKNIREPVGPDLSASLADAKTAVDLLKAQKELQQVLKKARAEKGSIDKSDVEPKAYVLEYTDDPGADAAVAKDIDGDLRTVQTRAFLSEFQKLAGEDPTETLGKHIGVGAYNSVNSLALAVGGDALVDRSVVDVLGIAGAAQVLARRIHTDLPPEEVEKIAQGVEDFHMEHYMAASREAIDQARELTDAAKAIEIGDAADGSELAVAQEMNDRRRKAIVGAQKILGQTLGEMEANAAISMALKQGKKDNFQVSLGKTQITQAIQQARAIGLQRGDYKIDSAAGNTFLSINGDGLDRLAKPINRADVEQVKRNLSIIRGDQDEDGWLPLGVANRPDLVMDVKAGVAPRLAQPFVAGADLQQSLRDYIGGRAADGDAPGDIVADIQSADFFNKVGVHRADDYRAALDAVAPLKGQDGKMQRADDLAASFDRYADESVQRRYGETMSPMNKQKIKVDQKSVDALHRALAETPEGTAAYKQIGELTHGDQRALREFFQRNVAKESPDAGKLRGDLDKHLQSEPEKQTQDMFGETVDNPAHADWRSSRDAMAAKVNGASLTWSKYVETMGGNARAYESVQDLIRSKVAKTFVGAYNKLHADAPIKIGTASIRNNLNHLDATDPKARDERIAKERELVDGLRERVGDKYASGTVKDKMQAAREQRDAFEGAQMGFFSDETPLQDQKERELGGDERHTLGHQAERQIAGMMDVVGKNFKPGKPTKMWNVSMSGKFANQQRAIKMLAQNKRIGLAFGAGCVRGDTILHDANGENRSFYDWWLSGESPVVRSVSKDGHIQSITASPVFVKGFTKMRRILSSAGEIFVSENHLFLTERGWVFASNLLSSDSLIGSYSDEQISNLNPSDVVNALNSIEKAPNYQGDCLMGSHLCGEPPQLVEDISQVFSQVQGDAEDNNYPCKHVDVLELFASHIQGESHMCRLSKHDFCFQFARLIDHEVEGQTYEDFYEQLVCRIGLNSLFEQLSSAILQKAHEEYLCFGLGDQEGKLANLENLARRFERANDVSRFSDRLKVSQQFLQQSSAQDKFSEQVQASQVSDNSYSRNSILSVSDAGYFITFDIHVPVNNNYFANGLIHHNSGKTNIMLGAHAHLSGLGKIKRSIVLCPSVVQGQFAGEALRLLEPGKFKWHIEPGASQESRIAAYKDPETHIAVMTHQSFRGDMIHLGAKAAGVDESVMAEQLNAMSPGDRKSWIKGVMDKEGINFDASFVDEAHETLNRAGKENSSLANVTDALSSNTPYYAYASGESGVKNDTSEIYSMMEKLDPERYSDRAAFMRRYGADTLASKDALKREMARYVFPASITPDVQKEHRRETVDLTPGQKSAMDALSQNMAKARLARMQGKVDIDAMKAISPGSFDGVADDQVEAVAKNLQNSIGIMKSSAVQRIINSHPDNAKINRMSQLVAERKGKQGVVFAHGRADVEAITKRLTAEGKRVVTITGSDSAEDKDRKRKLFNPEKGEAQADILVASDAGAVGMNLQSGQYLIQHDIPNTAKTHAQRNARIDRIGQKNNIELIDMQANHPEESRARERLTTKYGLRDMMTSSMDGLDDTGVAYHIAQQQAINKDSQNSLF